MNPEAARRRMVEEQLERRGIRDPGVLAAFQEAPRHLFVDEALADKAYGDHPLPLGSGQTISQPYMVALMTEELRLKRDHTVLEIGSGTGYQTYILSRLAGRVFTIERMPELARKARVTFDILGIENIASRIGDGSWGWKEYAPFDRIIATAAAPRLPRPWGEQLAEGGILLAPLGEEGRQVLMRFTREQGNLRGERICPCSFVPMIGSAPTLDLARAEGREG